MNKKYSRRDALKSMGLFGLTANALPYDKIITRDYEAPFSFTEGTTSKN